MYERPTLGLADALKGLHAVLDAVTPDERQVAVAVVDHRGEVLCYAAMDHVMEPSRTMSVRKAFTAAWGGTDSGAYARAIREMVGVPVETLFDQRASSSRGGVAITRPADGLILGGVGVSGAVSADRDEELGGLARDAILAEALR